MGHAGSTPVKKGRGPNRTINYLIYLIAGRSPVPDKPHKLVPVGSNPTPVTFAGIGSLSKTPWQKVGII